MDQDFARLIADTNSLVKRIDVEKGAQFDIWQVLRTRFCSLMHGHLSLYLEHKRMVSEISHLLVES